MLRVAVLVDIRMQVPGASQNQGYLFGSPCAQDYSILGLYGDPVFFFFFFFFMEAITCDLRRCFHLDSVEAPLNPKPQTLKP